MKINTIAKKFIIISIGIILSLILFEALLRLLGYKPNPFHVNSAISGDTKYTYARPDAEIGWVNKEGTPLAAETGNEKMTILKDGQRLNATDNRKAKKNRVVMIGCSFTMGYGVKDKETFPYLLDEKYINSEFQNYGSGGYGTLQSYMLLKRILNSSKKDKPDLVIYNYFSHHKDRNIVSKQWAFALTDANGRTVNPPHALFNNSGSLIVYPFSKVREWPLEKYSALVSEVHKRARIYQLSMRTKQRDPVTVRLVSDMNDYVKKHGSKFLVVVLHPTDFFNKGMPQDDSAIALMREKNIDTLVCKHPDWDAFVKEFKRVGQHNSPLLIGGWGHPNSVLHQYWADCISEYIDKNKLLR